MTLQIEAITGLKASSSVAGLLSIQWQNSTPSASLAINLYSSKPGTVVPGAVYNVAPGTTNFVIRGLTPGKTYYVRVIAFVGTQGAQGKYVAAKVMDYAGASNFRSKTLGTTAVSLSWNPSPDPGATYDVVSNVYLLRDRLGLPHSQTTFDMNGLNPNTSFSVSLVTHLSSGRTTTLNTQSRTSQGWTPLQEGFISLGS
jgi:hypothetical protein